MHKSRSQRSASQRPPHQRRTLSSPTGPRELLTMLAMAATAVTFCVRTSWPDDRSPCSCRLLAARAAILLSAAPASHRAGPALARPSRRPPRGRSSTRLMAPAVPWWPLAWWLNQSGVARRPFSGLFFVLAVSLCGRRGRAGGRARPGRRGAGAEEKGEVEYVKNTSISASLADWIR